MAQSSPSTSTQSESANGDELMNRCTTLLQLMWGSISWDALLIHQQGEEESSSWDASWSVQKELEIQDMLRSQPGMIKKDPVASRRINRKAVRSYDLLIFFWWGRPIWMLKQKLGPSYAIPSMLSLFTEYLLTTSSHHPVGRWWFTHTIFNPTDVGT